jgi:AcrR family transcriptional regulator
VEDIQGGRSRKGRQAEARQNDQAVLDAARLVFAVHGPDAAVSAVAAKAGVGIGGLYRRYASKEELLQRLCRDSMAQQIAAAEAGLAGDEEPWDALAGFIRACVSFRAGALSVIAGTIPVTEEMIADAQRAHELLELLVTRARQAGALRPDIESVDLNQLIELFSRRRADDGDAYQRLLAIVLDGLRAPGTESLPGSASTWESYSRRWSPG